jgi:hypothetical protein
MASPIGPSFVLTVDAQRWLLRCQPSATEPYHASGGGRGRHPGSLQRACCRILDMDTRFDCAKPGQPDQGYFHAAP